MFSKIFPGHLFGINEGTNNMNHSILLVSIPWSPFHIKPVTTYLSIFLRNSSFVYLLWELICKWKNFRPSTCSMYLNTDFSAFLFSRMNSHATKYPKFHEILSLINYLILGTGDIYFSILSPNFKKKVRNAYKSVLVSNKWVKVYKSIRKVNI